MRPTLVCIIVLCASASAAAVPGTPPATAASVPGAAMRPARSPDPKLEALKKVAIHRPAKATTAGEAARARADEAGAWLAHAEKLRAYREGNPAGDEDRREARHLEYVALLNAERAGNDARKNQRAALLQEIRADHAVPVARRCEAVARAKYLELRNRRSNAAAVRTPGPRRKRGKWRPSTSALPLMRKSSVH